MKEKKRKRNGKKGERGRHERACKRREGTLCKRNSNSKSREGTLCKRNSGSKRRKETGSRNAKGEKNSRHRELTWQDRETGDVGLIRPAPYPSCLGRSEESRIHRAA